MDDFTLFSCNIGTNEATTTIISLEMFGKLNIFKKMSFQEVYVMKMKISNFFKTCFFSIKLNLLMIILLGRRLKWAIFTWQLPPDI